MGTISGKTGFSLKGFAIASMLSVGTLSLTACGSNSYQVQTPENVILKIDDKYYDFEVIHDGKDPILTDMAYGGIYTTDGYTISIGGKTGLLYIEDPDGKQSVFSDWSFVDSNMTVYLEDHELDEYNNLDTLEDFEVDFEE